jgi:hypothetical protein
MGDSTSFVNDSRTNFIYVNFLPAFLERNSPGCGNGF